MDHTVRVEAVMLAGLLVHEVAVIAAGVPESSFTLREVSRSFFLRKVNLALVVIATSPGFVCVVI